MKPWRTITRTTVFDRPPHVRVESHRVELPDGRMIEDWPWVVMPDYVNVVAVTEAGLFIMFRQTKYSVRVMNWSTSVALALLVLDDAWDE